MELAGIRDILTKSLGSTNAVNTVNACLQALRELRSPDVEAARRGKTVAEIVGKKQAERIAAQNASAAEQAAAERAAREEQARESRITSGRRGSGTGERDRERRGGGGERRGGERRRPS
jgi:small subunit ribosomal protein S5